MNTRTISSDTELVLFDTSGTLIDVVGSVGEIYVSYASNYDIIHDPITVQQDFVRYFHAMPPLAFQHFSSDEHLFSVEKQWWKSIVQNVFPNFTKSYFDNFFDDVYECFAGKCAWKVYDDVIPALTTLKEKGIKLAALSNFDSRIENVFYELEIDQYFDAIHYSSRIGFAKPDPQIFQYALNYHNSPPHKTVHVGDRLREDVEGALAAGITPVLIDRENKYAESQYRINKFDELI